jgi:hypothetical protein
MNTRILFRCGVVLAAALTTTAAAQAQEKLPADAKVVRLEAFPKAVELKHPFDYRQLLLTAVLANGERVDVTRIATADVAANFVQLSPQRLVRPTADGSTSLEFTLQEQSVTVPVKVSGQKEPYEVSFIRDVMPVLGKVGCNAGTCHGAQQGKNGFQLSLRGYDPAGDHRSLTDDLQARRFNRAAPDRSLMLLKTSGAVAHVGGVLTQPGEPYYELLRTWIAEGVKFDGKTTRVKAIEVFPKGPVLPLPGTKQQMVVLASYDDGSTRDVTAEAIVDSSNIEVATVDKHGLVTAVRRGEAAVMVRYEGAYTATSLIVMGDRTGFAWQPVPEFNEIDRLVYAKLKQVKVLPSELCTDSEFIRRVHIDLTGLPPTAEDVRAFLADKRESQLKRGALVDKLVGSPDFIEHWTNKWSDLLQVNRKFLGEPGAKAFREWIKKAVTENTPYDQFARSILTASGSNIDNPPAAYYKILRDPGAAMENTTHLFLAVRFNCNKCHDHPFERWTQTQYYQMSAYFAQVGRQEDPKFKGQKIGGTAVMGAVPLVEVILDKKDGEVTHARTGELTLPAFPFQHRDLAPKTATRRQQLSQWITSKENPYFARSYVNRVWSYLLGVGLIEPVDDIRAGNPPTNPQLLDRLTADFIQGGFNTRELIKTICKSRTYQHSFVTNEWNKDDEINYSHALARRLPAEVLYDAIHRVTGSTSKLPGLPPGARAAQLIDSNVPIPSGFLDLFGRPARESACECERSNSLLLGPVLNLVNGPVMGDAIKDPGNRIARFVATEKDDAKVVEELFLAILNRLPTPKEMNECLQEFQVNGPDYQKLLAESKRRADALAAHEKKLIDSQPKWEDDIKKSPIWVVLEPEEMKSSGDATLTKQADGSILVSGKLSATDTYTVTAKSDLNGITAIRLEVMPDKSLPAQGPGRAPNGNFVLSEFKVQTQPADGSGKMKPAPFVRAIATFSQDQFQVAKAIDNNNDTGWAVSPQFGKQHTAVFEFKGKVSNAAGTKFTFNLEHLSKVKDHNIGRFRLSVTTLKTPVPIQGVPDQIAKILLVPRDKRSPQEAQALTNYQRSTDQELARLQRSVNELTVPPDARTMAAQDVAWALMNSPAFLFNH